MPKGLLGCLAREMDRIKDPTQKVFNMVAATCETRFDKPTL